MKIKILNTERYVIDRENTLVVEHLVLPGGVFTDRKYIESDTSSIRFHITDKEYESIKDFIRLIENAKREHSNALSTLKAYDIDID